MLLLGGAACVALLALFSQIGGGVELVPLAALALAFGLALVRFPLLGLALITVVIVSNASDNLINHAGLPSIAKAASPALAAILGLRFLVWGSRPLFDGFAASLFVVFGLVMAVSAVVADAWGMAIQRSTDYAKDLLIALLILAFFGMRRTFSVFLWALLLPTFAIVLLSLHSYATGDIESAYLGFVQFAYDDPRLSGPLQDPNFFGAMLVLMLPLAVEKAVGDYGTPTRVLGIAAFCAFAMGVALTGSRGAFVAFLLSFPVFLIALERRRRIAALVLAAGATAVALGVFYEEIAARIALLFEPRDIGSQQDISTEGRLASWKVAVRMFLDHPLLGAGAGNFEVGYQDYALDMGLILRGEARSAHSLYLEILAELGVVGVVVFAAILVAAFRGVTATASRLASAGREGMRTQVIAFGSGLLGYLVAMAFLHDGYPRLLLVCLVIAVALPRIAVAADDPKKATSA